MAVTLPPLFSELVLPPDWGIRYARTRGGVLVTGRDRDAMLGGRLTTGTLMPAEWASLVATLFEVVDKNLRVDLVLPRFTRPRAYIGAAWPVVGIPTIEAVTDLYTLSVAGLDLGVQLQRGDRICLHKGELRCHRIIAADVEVSSATAQAIPIVPRLPLGVFAAADEVHFIDPVIRLAVLADTLDMPEKYSPAPIAFDVVEALA